MRPGEYRSTTTLQPNTPGSAPNLRLRQWQAEAMAAYHQKNAADFLAVATPGAGKTTFALSLALDLFRAGLIRKVTVVCPTEHLKSQWADAAARFGLRLDPAFSNAQGYPGEHFDGVCVTYAQVGANPQVHQRVTAAWPTLVILDEIHHAGDALTWGDGVEIAFSGATRRLALTGTPFRSDTARIPFVTYLEDEEGIRRSRADYTYGYGSALADGVVRPVLFLSYSGQMRWRTRAGDEVEARLGEPLTKDMTAQAWRTALDPKGEWIPAVLAAANKRLSEVRRAVPDAGGLVIASDQNAARAYAAQLGSITGESPTVVLSDDEGASEKIDAFSQGTDRWMVAVRMVSEGVDVPRLAVGVYATSASTPLFFAQAVGRFVRARTRGETASVFLPSVAPLLGLAADLEVERDHALDRPASATEQVPEEQMALDLANREEKASSELALPGFEALDASAEFDQVLFDGTSFGTGAAVGTEEEQDFLGIPGLLEPEQVTTLLRQRQAEQMRAQRQKSSQQAATPRPVSDHRARAAARKELSQLVSAWASRTGQAHAIIHTELRRVTGGPEVAKASTEDIQARIKTLRNWFVGRR